MNEFEEKVLNKTVQTKDKYFTMIKIAVTVKMAYHYYKTKT